jgi:carbamoylphosphate synthase small subunit
LIEKGRPRGQQLGLALVKMTSGHRSIGQPCFAFTLKKLSGTFHNDNFHMKAAGNIEEIKELLEAD